MKSKLIILSLMFLMTVVPALSLAQTYKGACDFADTVGTIQGLICKAGEILAVVLPFLVALAVIMFVWGVIQYVISDDEEAKSKGRDRMIFGIIGLAVIVALWGLVKILTKTFDLEGKADVVLPLLPY